MLPSSQDIQKLLPGIVGADPTAAALLIECRGQTPEALEVWDQGNEFASEVWRASTEGFELRSVTKSSSPNLVQPLARPGLGAARLVSQGGAATRARLVPLQCLLPGFRGLELPVRACHDMVPWSGRSQFIAASMLSRPHLLTLQWQPCAGS